MGEIDLFVAEIEVEVEEIPEAEQRPKMQHLNQFSVLGRCVFPGKVLSWTEAGGRRWRGSRLAAMAKNEEKKRSLRFSSLGLQLKTLAGSIASAGSEKFVPKKKSIKKIPLPGRVASADGSLSLFEPTAFAPPQQIYSGGPRNDDSDAVAIRARGGKR